MAKKNSGKRAKTKSPRKSSKRSDAAKRAARTRRENAMARSARAKKAAATRKRRDRAGLSVKHRKACEPGKKVNRKKRKAPCTPKIAARRQDAKKREAKRKIASIEKSEGKRLEAARRQIERLQKQAAESRRRRHRKPRKHHRASMRRPHRRHHKARTFNPISGWGEGAAAGFGLLFGALATIFSDRTAVTHALGTGNTDTPSRGQVYNADAPATPLWSSGKRIAFAGVDLVVPLGLSMATKKHPKTQTFFQGWFIASLAIVGSKLVIDGSAKMFGKGPKTARLFAPEISADNALVVSNTVSSTSPNGGLPAYTLTAGGTGPSTTGNAGTAQLGAPPAKSQFGQNLAAPWSNAGGTSPAPTTPVSPSSSSPATTVAGGCGGGGPGGGDKEGIDPDDFCLVGGQASADANAQDSS